MADVSMPRLSDSMEEGTILKWLKSDGDSVSKGEELVEIETDKANMTYEADEEGTLEIVAQEGDTLPVGETIARIGEVLSGDDDSEEDDSDEAKAEGDEDSDDDADAKGHDDSDEDEDSGDEAKAEGDEDEDEDSDDDAEAKGGDEDEDEDSGDDEAKGEDEDS